MKRPEREKVVIIGAGPAGLTAGIELLKTSNFDVTVLERDGVVGGLARTTDYKGYKFDIGPHHFITEDPKIEKWWKDLMGDDFIELERYTRIYYKKTYFKYPLEAWNVITGLNFFVCAQCVISYAWRRIFPIKKVRTFQDWVTNKFGYKLFSIFFKTYTEKLWGIPCETISSDWAAHRIKGFSLSKAIFYAFFGRWFKKNAPRTLSDRFFYPPYGSGQLWNRVADNLVQAGGEVELSKEVVVLEHDGSKLLAVSAGARSAGAAQLKRYESDYFLPTMPLKKLISSLSPMPPQDVLEAANSLSYRGLITVNLVINKKNIFPDHWLYIHDEDVLMGRIGNMNNFSDGMVADTNHTALSLEYFTFVDNDFWNTPDKELIELGGRELEVLGIVKASDVLDGMVLRTSEAYPIYNENYLVHLSKVLSYLKQFKNLELMGRNGLHRYNNMDLAMLSAMSAVDKIKKLSSSTQRPGNEQFPHLHEALGNSAQQAQGSR